mgnify:FL=1
MATSLAFQTEPENPNSVHTPLHREVSSSLWMMEESTQEQTTTKKKGVFQEKVHDLYFKVFPGSDCPVTGSAREKLIEASTRPPQRKEEERTRERKEREKRDGNREGG